MSRTGFFGIFDFLKFIFNELKLYPRKLFLFDQVVNESISQNYKEPWNFLFKKILSY